MICKFYLAGWSFSKLIYFYPVMGWMVQGFKPIVELLVLVWDHWDPGSSLLVSGYGQQAQFGH